MLPKAVAQRTPALCVCGQMINDSQLRTAAAMVKGSRPPTHKLACGTHSSLSSRSNAISLSDVHGWALHGRKPECVWASTTRVCVYLFWAAAKSKLNNWSICLPACLPAPRVQSSLGLRPDACKAACQAHLLAKINFFCSSSFNSLMVAWVWDLQSRAPAHPDQYQSSASWYYYFFVELRLLWGRLMYL